MEEISVVVQQEVGSISWNFEEIKKNLKDQLEVFKSTVYTDETIQSAKSDTAMLRKLAKEIEDRRKEVKAKCMEPYSKIEAQAKELTALIDEPIKAITAQINEYEERRKKMVKEKIDAYWRLRREALPNDIQDKAFDKLYDNRWLNATCTMKTWKDAIDAGIEGILNDIETIKSFKSEFEEDVMAVYKAQMNLQPAIMKMNMLNEQRDRILEMERKKKEEAERKAAEEAQKAAQEAQKPIEEPKPVEVPQKPIEQPHEPAVMSDDGRVIEVITLIGTVEQIEKIKRFVLHTGAKYKEVAPNE